MHSLQHELLYYPSVFMLWFTNTQEHKNDKIVSFFHIIIERRLEMTYKLFTEYLFNIGWKSSEENYLLLRPYLISNIDEKWINYLHELKSKFNLFDKEFYNVLNKGDKFDFDNKTRTTHYNHRNVLDDSKYYGYRQAWHMFTYADKKYRTILVEHWLDNYFDCTYSAFVDYYKLITDKDLPNNKSYSLKILTRKTVPKNCPQKNCPPKKLSFGGSSEKKLFTEGTREDNFFDGQFFFGVPSKKLSPKKIVLRR